MILTAAALLLAVAPLPVDSQRTPTPVPLSAHADTSREWAITRPTRGVTGRVVQRASTIPTRWRPFAACVLHRESGATLDRPQSGVGALNSSSSAAGRWQMLKPWQRGGSYMVRDRLVRFGLPKPAAREVRVWLGAHPIQTWPGVFQDAAGIEALERGGWRHWANGDRCDGLVPA